MAGKDSGRLWVGKEAPRMRAGPERKGWGPYGKLEQSVSITQA